MTPISIICVLGLSLLAISKPPNINNSFDSVMTSNFAYVLVNVSTTWFPGAAMLNYLLYGNITDAFGYKEFIDSYGYIASNDIVPGDIILGRDALLGAICGAKLDFVIPVTGGKVLKIPKKLLSVYFPRGYIVKRNHGPQYPTIAYWGYMNGSMGGYNFCNDCAIKLKDFPDYPVFTPQALLYFDQENENNFIDMAGHFYQYDSQNMNGTFIITFTNTNIMDKNVTYQPVDLEKSNTINFSIDKNGAMTFYGSILIYFPTKQYYYNFRGLLNSYPHTGFESQ